jgi:hypothetical protein
VNQEPLDPGRPNTWANLKKYPLLSQKDWIHNNFREILKILASLGEKEVAF